MLLAEKYSTWSFAETINGTIFRAGEPDREIEEVIIDSRKPILTANAVFFALITSKNDGHKYIKELYDKGVRVFVVSKVPDDEVITREAVMIRVSDTLSALQNFAFMLKKEYPIPVIGITGSNGKKPL